MKRNHKKLLFSLSKITCAFAMALAVLSVNSTCCFTAYQPDVPELLNRKSFVSKSIILLELLYFEKMQLAYFKLLKMKIEVGAIPMQTISLKTS